MVAALSYCRVDAKPIPVDQHGNVLTVLIKKLTDEKPLTLNEMRTVNGFRQLVTINSRRIGTDGALILAMKVSLFKGDTRIASYEFSDKYCNSVTIPCNTVLPIPSWYTDLIGTWKIVYGYAAVKESEFVKGFEKQILHSLRYVYDSRNVAEFTVVEFADEVKPNGEWSHQTNAGNMAQSGSTNPNDI